MHPATIITHPGHADSRRGSVKPIKVEHAESNGAPDSPAWLGILTAICAASAIVGRICVGRQLNNYAVAFYVVAYISGGWAPFKHLVQSLWQRQLDVNLLMILAAIGAAAIGQWGEGATLLFLFSLSGALETYTMERTARSIEGLIELRPNTALVLRNGTEQRVPIEEIVPGDRVRIMPAERIAVDGRVIDGATAVDQATITGESIPVSKRNGDRVFAGTLNQQGSIVVQVEKTSRDTMLAKIIGAVREARSEKADTEKFIDRWQKPYVIAVIVATLISGVIHYFFPHTAAIAANNVLYSAVYESMVLLVAASPCAVMIATPAATLAGITRGALNGVLFKGGTHLERFADITVLACDKTGTITQGIPAVTSVWAGGDSSNKAQSGSSYSEKQLSILKLAASIEQRSEHPLAQAVVAEAHAREVALGEPTEFESHTGEGVHAVVGGYWIGVGKVEMFESHHRSVPQDLVEQGKRVRENGETALLVLTSNNEYGVIGVADPIRPEAASVIKSARQMGVQHVLILTGDHERVAQSIARTIGADQVRADLLPGQKVAEIKLAEREYGPVAMVGDGVNDAPALAAANIGVAMGKAGTDVALETADVVMMKNDLRGILTALWLSRRTRAAISRGLILAFSIIGVLLIGTAFNVLPLWLAVLGHEGSTVATIFSGLYVLVERSPVDNMR